MKGKDAANESQLFITTQPEDEIQDQYRNAHQLTVSTRALNKVSQKENLQKFINNYFHRGDITLNIKLYEEYGQDQIENIKKEFANINLTIKEGLITKEAMDFISKQYQFKGQECNQISPETQFKILGGKIISKYQVEANKIGIKIIMKEKNNKIKLKKNQVTTLEQHTNFYNIISHTLDHWGILIYQSCSENERNIKLEYFAKGNMFSDYQRKCLKDNQDNLYFFYVVLQGINQKDLAKFQEELNKYLEQLDQQELNHKLINEVDDKMLMTRINKFQTKNRTIAIMVSKYENTFNLKFKFFYLTKLTDIENNIVQKFIQKIDINQQGNNQVEFKEIMENQSLLPKLPLKQKPVKVVKQKKEISQQMLQFEAPAQQQSKSGLKK